MYRSEADLNMGFNCLALAALNTESSLLAEGFISTHHHGLASTPFEYPHCSANAFFRKALGKVDSPSVLPDKERHKYLPSNVSLPPQYRMSTSGLLLREDILDTAYVEHIYTSPRSFLFQMNKITDEKDLQKQKEENARPPITLQDIEAGVPAFSLADAKEAEYGKVNNSILTDLELCAFIDTKLVPKLVKDSQLASIYSLSDSKRAALCESLWNEAREVRYRGIMGSFFSGRITSEAQLKRCLCVR